MSDPFTIRSGERGLVRLFALNMPPGQVRFLQDSGGAGDVLGLADLNPEFVEVFPVTDLQGLGLAGYLIEGCGIPAEQIAPDRAVIDGLQGHVMIVLSRAFDDAAATLVPIPGVDLIGCYSEPATDWTGGPLSAESAKPNTGPRLSPRQARSQARRIGGIAFTVFMAIILVLVLAILL